MVTKNSNFLPGIPIYLLQTQTVEVVLVFFVVKNELNYSVLDFPNQFTIGVYESIWMKIDLGKSGSAIVGNIYRPNSAPKASLQCALNFHSDIFRKIRDQKCKRGGCEGPYSSSG